LSVILSTARLNFPFETDSPFLFAVYHLDRYPAGNDKLGPAASLSGHRIGADFGNPVGWSMYHGEEGVPGFPKHPHRGFETITITRQGLVDHTDSLGNGGRFGFGDVQWMTAGSGISHAEMFPLLNRDRGNTLELFQIWLNLPRASKMAAPSFKMLWAEELASKVVADGASGAAAEVVLVAGSLPGFAAPPAPPPDSYAVAPEHGVCVLTVKLAAGAAWTLPAYDGPGGTASLHRNLYYYAGSGLSVGGTGMRDSQRIKVRADSEVELRASTAGPVEVLVLQGRDIGEPVVSHGPFVGNTKEDIMKAFSDYQRTGFGNWPWDSDALVFPRERTRFAKHADGTLVEKPIPALR
jgi:redox-sensitive bicupin YhaK (pirin superfamily)